MRSLERHAAVAVLLLSATLPACDSGTSDPGPLPEPRHHPPISDELLCQLTLGKTQQVEIEQLLGPPDHRGGTACIAGQFLSDLQYYFDVDSAGAPDSGAIFLDLTANGTLVRVTLFRLGSRNVTPLTLCLHANAPPGFDPQRELACSEDGGVGGDAGADR